jgi:regulator of cell morphogenesis and NO signaling
MNLAPQTTVRDIVLENPQAALVFESFGIDYCCGGKRPLDEACRQANVALDMVLEVLRRLRPVEEVLDDRWNSASLEKLADHIVETHHAFVRRESPRLTDLLQKVRRRHATTHPELCRIEELFDGLASELADHMLKEERVLFPMIKRLEEATRGDGAVGASFRGIEFPIQRMMAEHDDAGEALTGIHSLTAAFHLPADACPSFRALYQGLAEFERDLHRPIHLENNILFPRAVEMIKTVQENCSAVR